MTQAQDDKNDRDTAREAALAEKEKANTLTPAEKAELDKLRE